MAASFYGFGDYWYYEKYWYYPSWNFHSFWNPNTYGVSGANYIPASSSWDSNNDGAAESSYDHNHHVLEEELDTLPDVIMSSLMQLKENLEAQAIYKLQCALNIVENHDGPPVDHVLV